MQSFPLARLGTVLNKPDAVLFVGSGLSMWSGLPSWTHLLEELANFRESLGLNSDLIRRELTRADLLQAASYGFMDLTFPQRRDFILSVCQIGSAVPSDAHRAVLGLPPRCFVTTNYDTLLEQALAFSRPGEFYQVITNRQPVDQPTILRATATQFVFKPHGNVTDIESVVLTREDYRRLAHEWGYTLQTLGTLLVTRPVVFVGYGLRDPDFLMVRDAIAAGYRGGAQDHYCLTLNPHEDEIRYWRESYGVHLIGYPGPTSDDSNRHSELLTLLKTLADESGARATAVSSLVPSPDQTLALIRLAARNRVLTDTTEVVDEIPLRLSVPEGRRGGSRRAAYTLASALYSKAMTQFEGPVFVYGPPGAGKTFGALRHIRRLAADLHTRSMAPDVRWEDLVLPLFISLRLYDGDLRQLVRQELPAGLELETLSQCRVFLVLDGVNEVPQAYLDDGSFLTDLDDLLSSGRFRSATTLLLGRALHEAPRREALILELDEIDGRWLAEHLPEIESRELWRSVSRPIVYRMIRDGVVDLSQVKTPADIYRLYFDGLLDRVAEPLRAGALDALAGMAFETVGDGSQAVSFGRVVSRLGRRHPDPRSLAATLVDLGFLQPVGDARVVFPHHSFLEYLAALELSHREAATVGTVTELSTQRSWDYVALFAASISEEEVRQQIVQQLLKLDLTVATRAVLYSSNVDAAVVAEVLQGVRDLWPVPPLSWELGSLVSQLPVSAEHESAIEALIELGGEPSVAGGSLMLKLRGP